MEGTPERDWFEPSAGVIITGAAGGLGRSMVATFLAHGCVVLAVDRDTGALERLRQVHPEVAVHSGDITEPAAPESVAEAAHRLFGTIRVLVNNAGITRHGKAIDYNAHDWDEVMAVNLRAPFLLSQACARRMNPGAAIVNIGSIGGRTANPNNVPYGVSKTALLGLTMHLGLEWGELGIRVNAVNPGMTTSSMADLDSSAAVKQAQADMVPLRRLPDPQDVANAVAFLASDLSARSTGQVLDVDSGFLLSLMANLPRGRMRARKERRNASDQSTS